MLVLCHANEAGFTDVWKNCEAVRVATNANYRVGLIVSPDMKNPPPHC